MQTRGIRNPRDSSSKPMRFWIDSFTKCLKFQLKM